MISVKFTKLYILMNKLMTIIYTVKAFLEKDLGMWQQNTCTSYWFRTQSKIFNHYREWRKVSPDKKYEEPKHRTLSKRQNETPKTSN